MYDLSVFGDSDGNSLVDNKDYQIICLKNPDEFMKSRLIQVKKEGSAYVGAFDMN